MKAKRIAMFCILILLLVGIGNLWAGGRSDSGTARRSAAISFWHTYTGIDPVASQFQGSFAKFQRESPDIQFEVEEIDSANVSMATRIQTMLAANDLPDVFHYWGGITIRAMVDNGLLMDVQEYLNATVNFKFEEITQAAWDYYTLDGVIRGFPIQGFYPAWFVNKEYFERFNLDYPRTMQDVIGLAPIFNGNGIIPLAMGSSGGNPGHFFFSDLLHQYAGGTDEIRNFGATNKFATENHIKAAQMILDLRTAGVFPQDTVANGDWTPSFELYNSGLAAMLYTNSWAFSNMSDAMFEKSVIIDTPLVDGASVPSSGFVQSSANYGFLVTERAWSDTNKQAALVRFIDWFLSDELNQALSAAGNVSVKVGVLPTPDMKLMYSVENFYQGRERVPAHFHTTSLRGGLLRFASACDELFAGAVSAMGFVNNIQSAYDEAYEEAAAARRLRLR